MTGNNTAGAHSGNAFPLSYAWESSTVLGIKIYDPENHTPVSYGFSVTITC